MSEETPYLYKQIPDKSIVYDAHLHSIYSDGQLTVKDLIDRIYHLPTIVFAIADHDSVEQNFEVERILAHNEDKYGHMFYISAGEFSACSVTDSVSNPLSYHILGYGMELTRDSGIAHLAADIRIARHRRFHEYMPAYLKEIYNIDVTGSLEPLRYKPYLGKADMNTVILNMPGIMADQTGQCFYMLEDYEEWERKKNIKVMHEYDARLIKELIEEADGIAALAHPGVQAGKSRFKQMYMTLKKILIHFHTDLQFRCFEAYNSAHSRNTAQIIEKFAADRHCFITGGSDFHGAMKRDVGIGSASDDGLYFTKEIARKTILYSAFESTRNSF